MISARAGNFVPDSISYFEGIATFRPMPSGRGAAACACTTAWMRVRMSGVQTKDLTICHLHDFGFITMRFSIAKVHSHQN